MMTALLIISAAILVVICVMQIQIFRLSAVSKLDTAEQKAQGKPTAPHILLDLEGKLVPSMEVHAQQDDTRMRVLLPTKLISELFPQIGELLGALAAGSTDAATMARLYDTIAILLSENAEQMAVDSAFVRRNFAPEEAVVLLSDYMRFVAESVDQKN